MLPTLAQLLRFAVEHGASDLHLSAGQPPLARVNGDLRRLELPSLTPADARRLIYEAMTDEQRRVFADRLELDFAYAIEQQRFRVNAFMQNRGPGAVLRTIPGFIPTLADLGLPDVVRRFAEQEKGLVLVTGPTGSGKSTTLAAMIDQINRTAARHVITVEDPIEYLHGDEQSIITLREIGVDCMTFAAGLKGALRQDPDVILVGEMRDIETIETAILAAETGHLVMSTVHTLDATETITRIIAAFPEHARPQARLILAGILKGVISQRLVPRSDGMGMVPAIEVMVSTALVKECIQQPERTRELRDVIAKGYSTYGMQTFDQSLMQLWREGFITFEEALAQSTNPDDFALKARGINSSSDSRWDEFDKDEEPETDEGIKVDRF